MQFLNFLVKKFILLLVILNFYNANAINNLSEKNINNIFSYSIKSQYGYIIIHSQEIRSIKNSYPKGVELNLNWLKNSKKTWELCNCYPKVGILISYFDFDNNEILGHGINFGGFVAPSFKISNDVNFLFKITSGPSYNSKPYHEANNPYNLSYSLLLNIYTQLSISIEKKINKKNKIILSCNYNHISNGGIKQPNKGINYPTIGLGIEHNSEEFKLIERKKEKYTGIKEKRYDISFSYFPKKVLENAKYYPVFGLNSSYSKQISRTNALTIDLEFTLDKTLEISNQKLNKLEIVRSGILIGHEFLLGKFRFSQKIGPYIYDKVKVNDVFYQKYGIKYILVKNIFVGLHIKAHRHVADFMQLSIGLSF